MKIVGINGLLLSEIESFLRSHARWNDNSGFNLDGAEFTTDLNRDLDLLVIFNTPSQNMKLKSGCPAVAFMMEPGHEMYHPWIHRNLDQFDRVFTPVVNNYAKNLIRSHGFLGWHIDMAYDKLVNLQPEDVPKDKKLSVAISDTTVYPGHVQRLKWLYKALELIPQTPVYGRGFRQVTHKKEMHWQYEFSLVLENTVQQDYITEKLLDCFLSYTIPIYRGAVNVESWFPSESMINVSGDSPERAAEKIKDVLKSHHAYSERLSYLREARKIVIEKFNPLQKAADLVNTGIDDQNSGNRVLKSIQPNRYLKKIYSLAMSRYYRLQTRKERSGIRTLADEFTL